MDLSKLKWAVIILIVVGGGWLATEGGVNWAFSRATSGTPGESESADKINEATLTRYGGFLLATFRCENRLENYQSEADLLYSLYEIDADQYDERIPGVDELQLRIQKLVEVHQLPDPFDVRNQ